MNDDPAPQRPVQPDIDDCCRSGCTPCVFDLYDAAMERYWIALAAWEARQASGRRDVARSGSTGGTP